MSLCCCLVVVVFYRSRFNFWATYVVYGTGMLEFNVFLAFVFAVGVCGGVSTWFYILLSLLKKYKQVHTRSRAAGLSLSRFLALFLRH